MQDGADLDRFPTEGSWDGLAEYMFDEIRHARVAKNHVTLGFGAAQLVVLLLGLYAGSKVVVAYVQTTVSNDRFYGPQFPELAVVVMILVAIVAVLWLMLILQRLSRAFRRAIAIELRDKGRALLKRLSLFVGPGDHLPSKITNLLKEMGLEDDDAQREFA